jgi:hypothetical protein
MKTQNSKHSFVSGSTVGHYLEQDQNETTCVSEYQAEEEILFDSDWDHLGFSSAGHWAQHRSIKLKNLTAAALQLIRRATTHHTFQSGIATRCVPEAKYPGSG